MPTKPSGSAGASASVNRESRSTRSQRRREVGSGEPQVADAAAPPTPSKRRKISRQAGLVTSHDVYAFEVSDPENRGDEDDDEMEDELAEPVAAASSTPGRRGRPPKAKASATPAKVSGVGVKKSTPREPESALSRSRPETPLRKTPPRKSGVGKSGAGESGVSESGAGESGASVEKLTPRGPKPTLSKTRPESPPRETGAGERNVGGRDVGERDVGERDVGERDVGERGAGAKVSTPRGPKPTLSKTRPETPLTKTPLRKSSVGVTDSTRGPILSSSKTKSHMSPRTSGTSGIDTPSRRTAADRSARRKSARALIDRVVGDDATSDDEAGDEGLAREIFESSGDEIAEDEGDAEKEERGRDAEAEEEEGREGEEDGRDGRRGRSGRHGLTGRLGRIGRLGRSGKHGQDDGDGRDGGEKGVEDDARSATTPTKSIRGRKRKAEAMKRSPTPPRDLPPHEMYFFQNKPGLAKTSNNTLASLNLLTHDEYFSILRNLGDPHNADIKFLEDIHADSFGQWEFELAEGFNLCLYGYGSKQPLLHRFAKNLHSKVYSGHHHKIVILNGYVRSISTREVLSTISSAVDPSYKLTSGNPVALLQDVLSLLTSSETTLTLILNSADAPPLRKSSFYTILSQLAGHPRMRLACSVDTPDFSLLWDSGQRSAFNFVFHDCTTFARRSAAELEVVDEVHELLGRKARRVGGKDGVAFVLKSLPDNAKNLFRLLVGEVLVALDDEGVGMGGENPGVEYRMLYNKAVEEFICSSEMAFRTLLKEFHDHQMITSRKDVLGTELLSLPFRKEELEAILEDLMS
ncbi:Origin recognition complex subunit 2 [Diaporthe australafricana]|uniref:Origin recognition complex subunit 2 n=1 Tax=Diaporthe australafricana TaxID=127596 RepID=A0ABR3Y1K6_9PEZI